MAVSNQKLLEAGRPDHLAALHSARPLVMRLLTGSCAHPKNCIGRHASGTRTKRAAYRAGRTAELAAALVLKLAGYRILARRHLGGGGEIDIVAQRGATIAFVEVKLRPSLDQAQASIAFDKRRQMARAARAFVSRQRTRGLIYRADAVYCAPWRWPRHVPAAFELDLG